MKRKTLISVALLVVMLLNCILPVFQVNASNNEGISLNAKLYTAIKTNLTEQGISFQADDVTHVLTLSPEVISKITELNLNEGGIYDLTGLENFTSLKHLELSGNNLSKDSNLEVLNGLPLEYLDLSTNSLEDVSSIDSLIDTIQSNNGTVILTGQTVTIVKEGTIDVDEGSDNAVYTTFELPAILEKAGFLKSVWMTKDMVSESGYGIAPYIEKMSNPITSTNNYMNVRLISDAGTSYKGLLKLEIYIYDDATEAASAANINPAATNILNGSRFYIYVVVHDSDSEAITTNDTNLYKAIKEQLTGGQTVNPNLSSYPYNVDENGETIYETCTYTKNDDGDYILTIVGEDKPTYVIRDDKVYIIDYDNDMTGIYTRITIDGTSYKMFYYNDTFEKTIVSSTDDNGVVTYKEGFKVASNGEGTTLYIRAYDEAKTFVIDEDVLCNKITNLILNNKEIRDLTGLEKFVGLSSYLNVSHNYLTDIEPIYKLQENKTAMEAELQSRFSNCLSNSLSKNLSETKKYKEAADDNITDISDTVKEIIEKFKEASEIEEYTTKEVEKTTTTNGVTTTETVTETTKNENYEKDLKAKAEEIDNLVKSIWGYDETDETTSTTTHTDGLIETLDDNLANVTSYGKNLYSNIESLYEIYNNEYKLATVLTTDINYQDLEDYEAYKDKINGTSDSAKSIYTAELTRLSNYYAQDALTNVEKNLIFETLGISESEDVENPIAEYLSSLSEVAGTRTYWANRIEEIRQTGLYIEMINYCLINRLENPTATVECYVEQYLKNRISDFEYEGIDTTFEQNVYAALNGELVTGLDEDVYEIFENFLNSSYQYTASTGVITTPSGAMSSTSMKDISACKGEGKEFYEIVEDHTTFSSIEEIASRAGIDSTDAELVKVYDYVTNKDLIKTIKVSEKIDNSSYKGDLNLYGEITALSGKLVLNSGEVSNYITLPRLKRLDVSYNAYLEGIEKISTLEGLREFYANACYITDITEVDWSSMTYLRKLGLAYNYIPSITPLEVLTHITEIDASHNLIAGTFEFNFTNSQETLEKLDLSYNQIDDITSIMEWLDLWSGGDDGNYLAREDTIDINLQNQTLTMDITDPIWLNEYPETVDIELPKIFTQLEAIDVERTAFGETSQNGRIESEGKYVTLNTKTTGEKQGVVKVIAMSGDGSEVDTCVGEGTTVTINYTVNQRKVNLVSVVPSKVTLKPGDENTFTATVTGENLLDTTVTWTIEGNTSEATTISEEGVLTIGADETAETINVIATSNFDNTKSDTAVVTISKSDVSDETTIQITPETATIKVGNSKTFNATVNTNVDDKTVVWSIDGNTSEATTISDEGVVTIGADETATTITVKAALNADKTKYATATITVAAADTVVPEVTGVKVNESATSVEPGDNKTFTATVTGNDLTDTTVTWSVEGNNSSNTKITDDGVLSVGSDETAETITVIATSNYDTSKQDKVTITIKQPTASVEDVTLGYNTQDEYLIGVKPKTPVADFKSILIGDQDYKVVIKKDGSEITSGYMQTGMYVQIQDSDGNVIKNTNGDLVVYEVIVTGDVNGDGLANSLDSVLIKAHRTETSLLTGEAFEAADINDDGKVNATDSKLLLYHRAEVTNYDLNYKK